MKIDHPIFQHRVYFGNLTQIRLGINSGWLNIVVEELHNNPKHGDYWLCVKSYQPKIPRVLTVLWLTKPVISAVALFLVERFYVVR